MKASRKNLVISFIGLIITVALIGIMWIAPLLLARITASVLLLIYGVWIAYFADLVIEVRGEWNRKTIKRCKRRLMEAINQEPFGILTDRDVERIFKELENEV